MLPITGPLFTEINRQLSQEAELQDSRKEREAQERVPHTLGQQDLARDRCPLRSVESGMQNSQVSTGQTLTAGCSSTACPVLGWEWETQS